MAAKETDWALRICNGNTPKPLAMQSYSNVRTSYHIIFRKFSIFHYFAFRFQWNPNVPNWFSLQSNHLIYGMGASCFGTISQSWQQQYYNCNPLYNYRNACYNTRSQTSLTQAELTMQKSQENYLSRVSLKYISKYFRIFQNIPKHIIRNRQNEHCSFCTIDRSICISF